MQDIKDLIFIVNKRRLSKIENLDKTLISSKDTLFSKFYHGLYEGKYENDDAAAKDLYGTDKSDYRYRQLKHRFRKRLLNTLYFLNINSDENLSEYDKQYYECLNRMHICNIVQKYGGLRSTTVSLINDMYPIAEKNMFLEALVEYSYKLSIHYSLTGNEKKFRKEIERYNTYNEQLNIIRKSVIIYQEVVMLLYNNTYITSEHEMVILNRINELQLLFNSCKVLTTYFYLTYITLIYNDYTGNNAELLSVSHDYLTNYKKYIPTGNVLSSYLSLIQIYYSKALLINRKYAEAVEFIQSIKKNVSGSNWFLISEFELKAHLNNKEIQASKHLINMVRKHPQFKANNILTKERWVIYAVYVDLYEAYLNKTQPNMRIAKLQNELKETLRDKAGFNLSLRVLEVLSLLSKGKWVDFIGKTEALNTYYKRHLNAKPFIRAKLFLKLIFNLEKFDLNYKKLTSLKEHDELKNDYAKHVLHESEIINYDTLWDIMLFIIKQNKK